MDCLPGKILEEQPENLSYLTPPLRDPIREEANAGTHNGCKSYYYDKRIGMSRCMHDMANMMRCNLSELSGTVSDTQFRVHVVFLPAILNVD